MPRYKVFVSEHIAHEYLVNAPDDQDAVNIVEEKASEVEPDDSDTVDWFVVGAVPVDESKEFQTNQEG